MAIVTIVGDLCMGPFYVQALRREGHIVDKVRTFGHNLRERVQSTKPDAFIYSPPPSLSRQQWQAHYEQLEEYGKPIIIVEYPSSGGHVHISCNGNHFNHQSGTDNVYVSVQQAIDSSIKNKLH